MTTEPSIEAQIQEAKRRIEAEKANLEKLKQEKLKSAQKKADKRDKTEILNEIREKLAELLKEQYREQLKEFFNHAFLDEEWERADVLGHNDPVEYVFGKRIDMVLCSVDVKNDVRVPELFFDSEFQLYYVKMEYYDNRLGRDFYHAIYLKNNELMIGSYDYGKKKNILKPLDYYPFDFSVFGHFKN